MAAAVSGAQAPGEAVMTALQEFIVRHRRARLADSFGELEWDGDPDPKADRRSRDPKSGIAE
ncbi:MAG: hypothetical protein LBO20_08450 [Bifidobacteriaceae bacterium]|nr:hypothetical protein [Bifidobacteriaceae bacterium]